MAADCQSGRQGITEAATMGGSGRCEAVRQVRVDGRRLEHEVSGMCADGVRVVPLLSRAGALVGLMGLPGPPRLTACACGAAAQGSRIPQPWIRITP